MIRKLVTLASLAGLASACASFDDPATQSVPAPALRDYNVTGLNVTVPDSLVVSEANAYYPGADIVWRGDPLGNRYEQVEAIFDTAFTAGLSGVEGSRDVLVDVEVQRFHALTEKARYTVGGVHSITFFVTVLDEETGTIIEGPRRIKADLNALGGQTALDAERRGETQKVRITQHLTAVSRGLFPDSIPAG